MAVTETARPRRPRPLLRLLQYALTALLLLGSPRLHAAGAGSTWKTEALEFLDGMHFKCAHMATPTSDGFFRVRKPNGELHQAMKLVQPDEQLALNASDITGMSVNTLEALRAVAAAEGSFFNISYFYHPVSNFADTSAMTHILSMYDCVISAVFITAERTAAMDFQLPHTPFGFQLMTTFPTLQAPTIVDRITACLRPFSVSLWLTILGLVIVSGVLIGFYEGSWGHNTEFEWWQARETKMASLGQTDRHHLPLSSRVMDQADRFGYSLYKAVTNLSTGGGINPHTSAGRVYLAGLCLCFVIFISSYTANLAAQLTTSGMPVQLVTGVDSFASIGSPCCVRNTSTHLAFVKQHYPTMPIYIVSEQTEVALAEHVLDGYCAGALSTSANLDYLFASNSNYSCSLQLVGSQLNFAFFAIPWTLSNLTDPAAANKTKGGRHSVADAMNLLMGELIDNGVLNQLHEDNFSPPVGGAACASSTSSDGATSLGVQELAGIFILQAVIAAISLVCFAVMKMRSKTVRSKLNKSTNSSIKIVVVAAGLGRFLKAKLRRSGGFRDRGLASPAGGAHLQQRQGSSFKLHDNPVQRPGLVRGSPSAGRQASMEGGRLQVDDDCEECAS